MKKILAILALSCLLVGMLAPVVLADTVRITSAVTAGKSSPLADAIKPASATVQAGKPFSLTFTYQYNRDDMPDLTLLFAVDCTLSISVKAANDGSYGYLRAIQNTPKSHDVYASTAYDKKQDDLGNPYTVPRPHGNVTVTVSGTAPAKGDFVVKVTPRGQATIPFTVAVTPAKK